MNEKKKKLIARIIVITICASMVLTTLLWAIQLAV